MRRIVGICVASLLLTMLAACAPRVPGKYIQPGEMEDILYDYHIGKSLADHVSTGQDLDYQRRLFFYAVLDKYGRTEAEFDSSMIYYYSHADRLAKIYDRVADRMAETANVLGAAAGRGKGVTEYSTTGDTANIWQNSTVVTLFAAPPYNRMDFEVEVDTAFRRGDSFQMNFNADFMSQGGTKEGVVYVAVTLSNDSTIGYSRNITGQLKGQVRIPGNNQFDVKRIRGFIYLGGGSKGRQETKIMIVDDIQFLRFHKVEKKESDEDEEEEQEWRSAPHKGRKDKKGKDKTEPDGTQDNDTSAIVAADTVGGKDKPRQVAPLKPMINVPRKQEDKKK